MLFQCFSFVLFNLFLLLTPLLKVEQVVRRIL